MSGRTLGGRRMATSATAAIAALMILAGCGSDAPVVRPPASAATPQETSEPTVGAPGVDLTRLPLGDGRISTGPERGAVWACETAFGGPPTEGARPWIGDDRTFDLTAKPIVEGGFDWPEAFTATVDGETRTLTGNGLPSHPTGVFPIPPGSEAFAHDPNPNRVAAQALRMEIPTVPEVAAEASCTPLGPIGVLLTGSVFMNALDAAGRDAVAHEVRTRARAIPSRQASTTTTASRPASTKARRDTLPWSGTHSTGSGCSGTGARTARRSPTATWTGATATATRWSGTGGRRPCTTTTRPGSTPTRWGASEGRPVPRRSGRKPPRRQSIRGYGGSAARSI